MGYYYATFDIAIMKFTSEFLDDEELDGYPSVRETECVIAIHKTGTSRAKLSLVNLNPEKTLSKDCEITFDYIDGDDLYQAPLPLLTALAEALVKSAGYCRNPDLYQ